MNTFDEQDDDWITGAEEEKPMTPLEANNRIAALEREVKVLNAMINELARSHMADVTYPSICRECFYDDGLDEDDACFPVIAQNEVSCTIGVLKHYRALAEKEVPI
jgi:hypothetical protein